MLNPYEWQEHCLLITAGTASTYPFVLRYATQEEFFEFCLKNWPTRVPLIFSIVMISEDAADALETNAKQNEVRLYVIEGDG